MADEDFWGHHTWPSAPKLHQARLKACDALIIITLNYISASSSSLHASTIKQEPSPIIYSAQIWRRDHGKGPLTRRGLQDVCKGLLGSKLSMFVFGDKDLGTYLCLVSKRETVNKMMTESTSRLTRNWITGKTIFFIRQRMKLGRLKF